MRVRQQMIADKLGLSVSTVSLALRDSDQIAIETRERVRDLARELGYIQRPYKRVNDDPRLIKRASFITPWAPSNLFYSAVLSGAEQECQLHHIALQFSQIERGSVRSMAQYAEADGLLLVGSIDEQIVRQFAELGFPLVLIDNNLPHLKLDRVLIDNYGSLYRVVMRLHALGHRSIALLCGDESSPSMYERLQGYRAAIARLGLGPIEISYPSENSIVNGEKAMSAWLAQHGKPTFTALIASNDEGAIEALHVFRRHGIGVPDQVSLVGFDGLDVARATWPPLATCEVPCEQLGAIAMRYLLRRIQHSTEPIHILSLGTTFIERPSIRQLEPA
jgi:DNA-binding LacI/PurR family transcriptional regulator